MARLNRVDRNAGPITDSRTNSRDPMSLLNTALAIIAFIGLFAVIEYTTYRVMEREHEKRGIYRLFFMLAWTTLALVHMWVVAPLLDLPPTAVIGLGFGILAIHIGGDLRIPVLRTVGIIGLYPFALVYQFFVLLLLTVEGVTFVGSFVSVSQFGFISEVVPDNPQIQAALGLGIAASLVALLYYDPQGENGYYYAAGDHLPDPTIDSEAIKQKMQEKQTGIDGPSDQATDTSTPNESIREDSRPDVSRASAKAPDPEEFEYNWNRSDIGFGDIGGYYNVKERIAEEVLQPVRATAHGDDRYDRFGIEPSRGILFYGPPGTGKTLFARALAGELKIQFVELGPADVTSKWINEGPQRIRQLFEEAQAIGPCVIFLDEAEHLFGGRDVGAGGAHAEDRKITSELLVHLTADDRTAIVVGATNRPEDIDPAILRPGRLATHLEIGLPEEESRHAIIDGKLRGVPHDLTGDEIATLASQTAGFSGADIEALVTAAKRHAANRDAQTISIKDFLSAGEFEGLAMNDHPEPSTDVTSDDEEQPDSASGNRFNDDSTVGFQ